MGKPGKDGRVDEPIVRTLVDAASGRIVEQSVACPVCEPVDSQRIWRDCPLCFGNGLITVQQLAWWKARDAAARLGDGTDSTFLGCYELPSNDRSQHGR